MFSMMQHNGKVKLKVTSLGLSSLIYETGMLLPLTGIEQGHMRKTQGTRFSAEQVLQI